MKDKDILALNVRDIASAIRARALTVRAVTEAHLRHIDETDGPVMAWQHLDADQALASADAMDRQGATGLLAGVPIGVKDVIDTADMPTGYGTSIYDGFQPPWDAAAVQNAKNAGGLILGKTVSTELAMASPNKTRNPHNPAHTPGGSSSGSCAAVAAGMVPVAFGTQTSGSVIRPASFCGVTAFKPSFGLINTVGIKVLCHGLDTLGIITRNIADAAHCAAALSGRSDLETPTPPARPRIGILIGTRLDKAEACSIEAVEQLASVAKAAGAETTVIPAPAWYDGIFDLHESVMGWEVTQSLAFEIARHWDGLTPVTRSMLEDQGRIDEIRYRSAMAEIPGIRHLMDSILSRFDAVLTLAAPGEAPKGMATGDPIFNRLWSVLQVPLICLPVTKGPQGMPVGVQLVGARGSDHRLVSAALFLETAIAAKRGIK
ncbi:MULTISPECIES: amidase [Alphaproteobacteria]|uniref:Amidase n=2 Tax=Alphaproteobacteria TaxID=28211 RepID=A0A512HNZ0_9HYPH|nr:MULTISPECIES: amidase [Alphaproteobacteria]GEO87110.1 amidase [Ciceribacter naphthalenivorans]GLR22648.1 amidase [Ciceribacter naphthalenivorans]GLT05504.1 amidase [Sphingomonas psychrolutea]